MGQMESYEVPGPQFDGPAPAARQKPAVPAVQRVPWWKVATLALGMVGAVALALRAALP